MMLCHGWPKLLMLVQGQGGEWMDPLGIGAGVSLGLCVFAEFFCSMAILAGLFTRAASFVLAVNFWVVVFVYGEQSAWQQNELPILYLVCYVTLLCTGAGPLSLDHLMTRRLRCRVCESGRASADGLTSARPDA